MYKVFIDNSKVIFKESDEVLNDSSEENVSLISKNIERQIDSGAKEIVVRADNVKEVFDYFFKSYKKIDAAGGIVFNSKKEFLVISRLGKWDLPKGKVEKDEKIEEAAVREVEEECGITNVNRLNEVCKTYHTYQLNGASILKRTIWYHMEYKGEEALIPQTEENITEAKWLPWADRETIFDNTYGNIIDVIRKTKID